MKVVTARERFIDLSNSVLTIGEYREQFMAQPEGKQPIVKVNGCGLIDEDERLQPLVSTYLSLNLRKKQIAFASVKSYASRLSLLLQDLKTNVEFEGCYRDDAFLSVTIGRLETYLANLAANGLAPKTIQTRDAAHLHFFSKFLCRSFDGQPALRADNPYEDGMLWTGKANTLGIVQPSSLSELEQLILHALSERERCLIQAVYDSGTRVSEVPRITLQAVRDALDFHKLRFVASSGDFPLQPDYCPLHIAGSKGRRDQIKPRITLVSRTVTSFVDIQGFDKVRETDEYRPYAAGDREKIKNACELEIQETNALAQDYVYSHGGCDPIDAEGKRPFAADRCWRPPANFCLAAETEPGGRTHRQWRVCSRDPGHLGPQEDFDDVEILGQAGVQQNRTTCG